MINMFFILIITYICIISNIYNSVIVIIVIVIVIDSILVGDSEVIVGGVDIDFVLLIGLFVSVECFVDDDDVRVGGWFELVEDIWVGILRFSFHWT